jgi:FixJ family two-component response regulator
MSSRKRVAVVDDDHSVRKALRRLLQSVNFDVDAYGSVRAFLNSLKTSPPDCLVLDLQMPEMNGLELQRYLAAEGIRLPIVIITGHDEPVMEAQCIAAGASTFLRKPLDAKEVLEAIIKAIS